MSLNNRCVIFLLLSLWETPTGTSAHRRPLAATYVYYSCLEPLFESVSCDAFPVVSGGHLPEGSSINPDSSGGSLVTGERRHSPSSYNLLRLSADPEQALPKGKTEQVCLDL